MRGRFAVALVVAVSCHRGKGGDRADAVAPIDKVYARYKADHTWIDPDDESKSLASESPREGSFATCAHCDYDICYEDLPIEHRLRIESDADLVRMVRWLRDPDACVRRVAEDLLWPKLGLPGDAKSISVQDREGIAYHSIACALKARLDAGKVAYDPAIFDGLVVSLTAADFAPMLRGTWRAENQPTVEIGSDTIRVSQANWAWSSKLDEVRVNAKSQFDVIGRPEREYLFWPVGKGTVWIAYSNEGKQLDDRESIPWTKYRKALHE